jgi:hypothetical protein
MRNLAKFLTKKKVVGSMGDHYRGVSGQGAKSPMTGHAENIFFSFGVQFPNGSTEAIHGPEKGI